MPFPYADVGVAKTRPTVVLSYPQWQAERQLITVMMITAAANSPWATDVPIQNWQAAGLKKPCFFREKIFHVDEGKVFKFLGRISDVDLANLQKILWRHFQFSSSPNVN